MKKKHYQSGAITLLAMALLCMCIARAQEPTSPAAVVDRAGRPYRERVTGTFASSTLDRNQDGVPASLSTFSGMSNLGKVEGSSSFEVTPFGPPVRCEPHELEAALVGTRDVRRFPDHGDMLFVEVSDLLLCLNPSTGIFRLSSAGHFIGGTGRHTGATGDFTASFTGTILVSDSRGAIFGAFSGGVTGTIHRP